MFTSYVNQLHGYHSQKDKSAGYKEGVIDSYYYALPTNKLAMQEFWPIKKAFHGRESPRSWLNIDMDVNKYSWFTGLSSCSKVHFNEVLSLMSYNSSTISLFYGVCHNMQGTTYHIWPPQNLLQVNISLNWPQPKICQPSPLGCASWIICWWHQCFNWKHHCQC